MKPQKKANLKFDSKAVYYAPDEATKSINAPIYMSSSFQYDAEIYQRVVDGERRLSTGKTNSSSQKMWPR